MNENPNIFALKLKHRKIKVKNALSPTETSIVRKFYLSWLTFKATQKHETIMTKAMNKLPCCHYH